MTIEVYYLILIYLIIVPPILSARARIIKLDFKQSIFLSILLPPASIIVIIMNAMSLIFVYILSPILFVLLTLRFSLFLWEIFNSSGLISNFNVDDKAITYIILTTWSFLHAYSPLSKKAYMFILNIIKQILRTPFINTLFEIEKIKVNTNLLSMHMHVILLILFIFYRILDFSDLSIENLLVTISNTNSNFIIDLFIIDLLAFLYFVGEIIMEALLTFVIIDTIISKRREWKKKMNKNKKIVVL